MEATVTNRRSERYIFQVTPSKRKNSSALQGGMFFVISLSREFRNIKTYFILHSSDYILCVCVCMCIYA